MQQAEIYEVMCPVYEISYIVDKPGRQFKIRLQGLDTKMRVEKDMQSHSAIAEHMNENQHKIEVLCMI